jgi:hypothetical protein
MQEAMSDVSDAVKEARCAAAVDAVLSWIPNCQRPMLDVGEYLLEVMGLVASAKIIRWNRGVSLGDQGALDALDERIAKERELIMASGAKDGIRLVFTDSTPDVDDFSTIGGGSTSADAWAQP